MTNHFPAYGRELLALRRRGLQPRGGQDLCISDGWHFCKAHQWRIVVRPEDAIERLDFTCVAGLSCLLMGANRARLDAIAARVLKFAPSAVLGIDTCASKSITYKNGGRDAR